MKSYLLRSDDSGDGPAIVLLHGYLSSSHYFKRLIPRLATTHRVISLDLLGFGRSPKPHIDYTYEDHLDAIKHTLEKMDIKPPFVLIGHSMGALIALRYAVTHPDDVSSVMLFNAPLFTDTKQMIETHRSSGRGYRIMLYSRGRHVYWPTLKLVPRDTTRLRGPINLTDITRLNKPAREGSYKNILGGGNVFQDLRKARMPVSLVVGRYDRDVYLENLRRRNLPVNVDVEIVDTDHHTLVKHPDIAEKLIRSHLTT